VAAEIVHDDDVAGLEDRNELLLDIGAEAFAVDRTVEDTRGGELIGMPPTTTALRNPATRLSVWL
jgi:hypothetical protein